MKKILFFPLFSVLLFLGCSKAVPIAQYDVKAKEVETLTMQNSNLQAQVKKLTSDFEAVQVKNKELLKKAEKSEQLEKATQTYQDLTKKMEKEIQEGKVQIKEMKNRLTMTMVDKILFPSGSADISKNGKQVLDKVISILKDIKDKRIQIEGHTDNVPIVSSLKKRYPTNWELSTARATHVVRYLQEEGGIDAELLSVTGYGENMPVASNDTEEGRRKNRRIEIVLLPLLK